ncbi:hypothetical protein L1987_75871 [Smallanthus sonchifolius]|uniref:Uncharacterized protein n=1 Tax=Smallanthus sonchifolius TaxID=185202 RepID=A0ACB9A663_9ASTR|nr:hypothetical protein L1987_75871 [Smallanthus sonchifolius]
MVKGRQGERVRLYTRGTILGYKRSKSNQYPNTSLIQIEGVNTKEEVSWYQGKRMAYVYKAKVKKNGSHYSSSPIFLPNLWDLGLECSCIQATFEWNKKSGGCCC